VDSSEVQRPILGGLLMILDVKVIAEWQGHKDGGKLILDTYSHVNRAHSERMAQLMIDHEPENVIPIEVASQWRRWRHH
jgi:hypothetical protein